MRKICMADASDKKEILNLYKMQLGREFCPWDDYYPAEKEIDFDLSRDALFIMRQYDKQGIATGIIAAISIDDDAMVEKLYCWTDELKPGAELARLAVHTDWQNQGIARKMLKYGMEELVRRGYKSVHFLVNKQNIKAIKSYEVLGFNIVGECSLYEQPFLCYEKELKTF